MRSFLAEWTPPPMLGMFVLFLVLPALLPWIGGYTYLGTEVMIWAIFALGYNLLLGHTGLSVGCAAEGSEEMAKENFLVDGLKVHYCPSRFKDAVQLRERLKRRAGNVARPFDFVTEDGTIIHGIISGNLVGALRLLKDLEVPDNMYALEKEQIDIAVSILEDISKDLKSIGCIVSLIETYPTKKGLIVESIAL